MLTLALVLKCRIGRQGSTKRAHSAPRSLSSRDAEYEFEATSSVSYEIFRPAKKTFTEDSMHFLLSPPNQLGNGRLYLLAR
jgi:hypothetical protein